jgi:hypothetical protein
MIPYIDSTSSYIYSVITDFGGNVSPACLHLEITSSIISSVLVGVFMEAGDDNVVINFQTVLSGSDQTTLDSIVAAHDPNCNLGGLTYIESTTEGGMPNDGDLLVYDSTAGLWISGVRTPEDFWESLGYGRSQSEGISSTTSQTFQNKISATFTNDSSSTQIIRVGYTAEFNAANNNKQVEVEFYETVLGVQHGATAQQTNNSTNWFGFAGFHVEIIPALQSRTFQVNFRIVTGGTTCSIRNTELEMWRLV